MKKGALLALAVLIAGAAILLSMRFGQKKPRPLDPEPKVSMLKKSLPKGKAYADFFLATGGDQLTSSAGYEAGLAVRIHYGNKEIEQVIASCRDVGFGTVLGGGGPIDLNVAHCDGRELILRTDGGRVQVVDHSPQKVFIVTEIPLPKGIGRATRHPN